MDAGLVVALFVIIALWSSLAFSKEAILARELRMAKRVHADTFPHGTYGRLVGAIRDGEYLTAPLSGKPCVYYSAKIELLVKGYDKTEWKLQAIEVRYIPLVIDDGTSAAYIDLEHCRMGSREDTNSHCEPGGTPTELEAAFLERHKLTFSKEGRASLRFTESKLEIGETIAVAGPAVREIDPDPNARSRERGYRDSLPTRVRMMGTATQPLLVSDYTDTLE